VTQVFLWIVQGQTEAHIIEAIQTTWPEADSRPLIAAALDEITKAGDLDKKLIRGWAFEASRELYRQMIAVGDFASALRAVKQIADMAG